MSHQDSPESIVGTLEETLIALLLGLMTVLTFANVIARYLFNSNILWALELTVFMFAWLVLLGISYGVKESLHIGVDIVTNTLSLRTRKIYLLLALSCCLLFSLLMLKGSWDYWYPFVTIRAFLETDDIPMPEILQFLAEIMNDGERYEKIPRFIPYFVLPLGMTLLTLRYLQLAWKVLKGEEISIIASHDLSSSNPSKPRQTDNL